MSFQQDSVIFKQKLYENFKQSGLLSHLQTTLRANLLQKIQKPAQSMPIKQRQQLEKLETKKPFHLRKKFIQNIVHDYLQKEKMEYTMSIFTPQCNLSEKDLLNFNVLVEITNFPKYQSECQNTSFLECLIDQWVKRNCIQKRQRSIQTEIQGQTVGKKLQKIEKDYLAKIDYWKLIPNRQVSENPSLFQLQQKLKAQFQSQRQKIKLDTQRIVKCQLQRKFQSQYQFRLNQISKQHQKRIQQLKFRQKQILESLEKKKSQIQQRTKQLSTKEFDLINKYETRQRQIQAYYKKREMDLETKEKQFWKKQLQLKAKKREYEETIRLVKQKAIGQAGEMFGNNTNQPIDRYSGNFTAKSSFYH